MPTKDELLALLRGNKKDTLTKRTGEFNFALNLIKTAIQKRHPEPKEQQKELEVFINQNQLLHQILSSEKNFTLLQRKLVTLIELGADVNVVDLDDNTVMHRLLLSWKEVQQPSWKKGRYNHLLTIMNLFWAHNFTEANLNTLNKAGDSVTYLLVTNHIFFPPRGPDDGVDITDHWFSFILCLLHGAQLDQKTAELFIAPIENGIGINEFFIKVLESLIFYSHNSYPHVAPELLEPDGSLRSNVLWQTGLTFLTAIFHYCPQAIISNPVVLKPQKYPLGFLNICGIFLPEQNVFGEDLYSAVCSRKAVGLRLLETALKAKKIRASDIISDLSRLCDTLNIKAMELLIPYVLEFNPKSIDLNDTIRNITMMAYRILYGKITRGEIQASYDLEFIVPPNMPKSKGAKQLELPLPEQYFKTIVSLPHQELVSLLVQIGIALHRADILIFLMTTMQAQFPVEQPLALGEFTICDAAVLSNDLASMNFFAKEEHPLARKARSFFFAKKANGNTLLHLVAQETRSHNLAMATLLLDNAPHPAKKRKPNIQPNLPP